MAAYLKPSDFDFHSFQVGHATVGAIAVVGATFTSGEVAIDGQDRTSFTAVKNIEYLNVTFRPVSVGAKIARVKVLIESDGPPYWIYANLQGIGI
jgi:hypothetical protein